MRSRQARLHPSFGDWYPGITPGKWHDALWVREVTLAQQRKGGPHWQVEGRVLCDTHFEFQGGSAQPGRRMEDRRMVLRQRASGTRGDPG
jgi:hypothetical protein